MAPIAREPDVSTSAQPNTEASSPGHSKPQAAAAEIAVTVNGARTVAGTDKREPFSENTNTVLVFPKGGVIRLSSPVAAGQLLFLTNEKTKKEVVCQVVKSKSEGSAGGYVELEFTEPAAGFWGMRFPVSPVAPVASSVLKPMAPSAAPPTKPLEKELAEARAKQPSSPATDSRKVLGNEDAPVSASKDNQTASIAPARPPASAIPTLSEFLTQGASGPVLKNPEKAAPELKSEASIQESKQQTDDLQKQLSAKLFAEGPAKQSAVQPPVASPKFRETAKPAQESNKTASLTNLLIKPAAKENPAPVTTTFDFGSDEVKIPAWLEPLARNSSASSPVQETKSFESLEPNAKVGETKTVDAKSSESPLTGSEVPSEGQEGTGYEPVSREAAVEGSMTSLSTEGPVPNFGSSLAFDTKSANSEGSAKGSGRGLLFGMLAAGLLLLAGAGWYWYSNQPKDVSANGTTAGKADSAAPAVADPSPTPASESPKANSSSAGLNTDANRNATNSQTTQTDSKGIGTAALGFSKSSAPASNFEAPALSKRQPEAVFAAPPATAPETKPSMGKVRLAAPVVSRHGTAQDNSSSDSGPVLGGNGMTGSEAGSLNMLSSKNNQPTAPVPIGGDVKPARLLSSVAPLYPQLARNQRLSGDVKIDALIDTNGRVSAMKVLSGPALLHQAAMDAVRQWKYQPATLNGQPMAMHLTVTVQFKLQ